MPGVSPLYDVHNHPRACLAAETCSLPRLSSTPNPIARGGARRDRTDDLMLAKHALSQLSYGPDHLEQSGQPLTDAARERWPASVVGLGRFELPTSRLSSARSNQLSYRPVVGG